MRKPTVKGLKRKLDKLWSLKVKERDDFKCRKCGRRDNLNSHHIFSRRYNSTRYLLDNGITLCPGHHTFSGVFSAHETPRKFFSWLEGVYGKEWLDKLEKKSGELKSWTIKELLEIIKQYEEV